MNARSGVGLGLGLGKMGYTAAVKLRRAPDGDLPAKGPARAAVIVALVVGGAVALLVPVFFAIMLFGMLQ